MHTLSMTKLECKKVLILSFFLGGSLGGLWETVWTFATRGLLHWKSGVMFFPLCNPIYALGAMLITYYALKGKSSLKLYIFSVLITTCVEFIFSCCEELVFKTVSWDYSAYFLNVGGRINLLYSLFWGLLALCWAKLCLPSVIKYSERVSFKTLNILCLTFVCLLSLSMVARGISNLDFSPLWLKQLVAFFYPVQLQL